MLTYGPLSDRPLSESDRIGLRRTQKACLLGCLGYLTIGSGLAALIRWIAYPNRLLEFAIATGAFTLAVVVSAVVKLVREGWEAGGILIVYNLLALSFPLQLLGGLSILLLAEIIGRASH